MHVQIELCGRLHNIKVKADIPSDNSNNATLNRKMDPLGYMKQSSEVEKQMKTEMVARVMDAKYSNMAKWFPSLG